MIILITGCAGFIGSHLCETILRNNLYSKVIGVDNFDPYYEIDLKKKNIEILIKFKNFIFLEENIKDTTAISIYKPDIVCHLASMAGVRYSIENPLKYANVNILGMIHLLEECKKNAINNFVFASSSSVYGLNKKVPFSENNEINLTNSPYATSKKCMENYGQLYNQLYNISITGLRFFTVYGPRGRPDMAPYKFLKKIINNETIIKYGTGESYRDYTYIDDIVDGILKSIEYNNNGFKIYNLGNNKPITLNEFINTCEKISKKKAKIKQINNQQGDVPYTYADISKAKSELNYNPKTSIEQGLRSLYEWLINNNC